MGSEVPLWYYYNKGKLGMSKNVIEVLLRCKKHVKVTEFLHFYGVWICTEQRK